MLVLTRGQNEEVVIGKGEDAVVVKIVRISDNKVRLGIEAPKHITVHRREIYDETEKNG